MNDKIITDVLVSYKKTYHKLIEVSTLTEQLASAVDRQDEISVQLVLSMRQEPLLALMEIQDCVREGLLALEEDDAIYVDSLLNGATPQTTMETTLSEQMMMNARLLDRIIELDKRVNTKLAGTNSYYNKYR